MCCYSKDDLVSLTAACMVAASQPMIIGNTTHTSVTTTTIQLESKSLSLELGTLLCDEYSAEFLHIHFQSTTLTPRPSLRHGAE